MKRKELVFCMCMLMLVSSSFLVTEVLRGKTGEDAPEILWWFDLDAPSFGSAAVADIDNDEYLEIVFGTYFNDEHIYALNAENGSVLWSYDTGGCNDASPAIADVDLDGDLEVILAASSPCRVFCFNGSTGEVEWSRSTTGNSIDSPPAIADVDLDDKPEVIFGTFNGYVYCFDGEDGGIEWRINLGTDSFIQSGPNILDLDNDQRLDIVVAQYAGDCRVYALEGVNGSVKWYYDEPMDYMYHGGSFADIDEDGKPEITIGCYDHHVYVINGEDGSPEWDYTAPYYIGAPTSIADLDNDTHLEIVYAAHNRIGVLSHTGGFQWGYTTGGSIFRGVSIADVDGDSTLDVAFGSADGILRVLRGDNGDEIWTYNLQAHYGQAFDMDHAPVIADFNNDGLLDIFIVGGYGTYPPGSNHGRAYALTAGTGTGEGWLMFRHDLYHSGCFVSIDAGQSTITLSPGGLTTCPAGDGPTYHYATVTVRNTWGDPVEGIPASSFTWSITPTMMTHWYDTFSVTVTTVDAETDANGEIRYALEGDTSISGNIKLQVQVNDMLIDDIVYLPSNSFDYWISPLVPMDGQVVLQDFGRFASDWGTTAQRSDFNWNGLVDLVDFGMFASHYGHHR